MSRVPRAFVLAQVEAMLSELELLKPGVASRLGMEAMAELESWEELVIQIVPEFQTNPQCSVAGAYISDENPPILAVGNSLSSGRRAFTVLHELGHHLQQTRPSLISSLLSQSDDGLELEDAACNSFAATVLLPRELVDRYISPKGPTAGDVISLWGPNGASTASRAAVCVGAAERLLSPGHVLLLDTNGTVSFDANHGLPPLRRGSDQSSVPVIKRALENPRHEAGGRTRLVYRDRFMGDELYAQVADMGGYLLAVLVTDNAAWEQFSPPARDLGPRSQWWTCEHCGYVFKPFGQFCIQCKAPTCVQCDRCNCPSRVLERVCPKCFITLPLASFEDGSLTCQDCT